MKATAGHWIRDVKENETFFWLGLGRIAQIHLHLVVPHRSAFQFIFFIFIVCFNWLLVKMSILGMWRGGGHSIAGW